MHLSVLLPSLPLPFEQAVKQAAALGFRQVDVLAATDRPAGHREALAETGLSVRCVSIGKDLADGVALDDADIGRRRAAVAETRRHLADAAGLGATHCYLVPGHDASPHGLARFADSCRVLAEDAGRRMIQLCVEHVPGRALPTVASALDFLNGVDRLRLLIDLGHCLISGEDPAAAVRGAGPRLGFVHLDDNDGVRDCHWPLLTGKLTAAQLAAFLDALDEIAYDGALTLELNPANADPVAALRQGRELLVSLRPALAS
jgi:sugar phosphate isomerase/epimerase